MGTNLGGGGADGRTLGRRQQQQMMHPRNARTRAPPMPAARPITSVRCRSTQEDTPFPPSSALPLPHRPLRHVPPSQGVPSSTCCPVSMQLPVLSLQLSMQESLLHEETLVLFDPICSLHCISRLVHSPLAQNRPVLFPQLSPSGICLSLGHLAESPGHVSSISHAPELLRQTVSSDANRQSLQHGPAASSHTAPSLNRHVSPLQHELSSQSSPQSQSSPASTIPFPHSPGVMVGTSSLLIRQFVRTSPDPMAEQTFPSVQGEKSVCEELE